MAGPRRTLQSRTWGALPLVNEFLRRLGIDQILEGFLPHRDRRQKLSPARAIGLLVRNLLIARRPLYALGEWAQAFEPGLLALAEEELASLNDDRVGRALDRLFDADRSALVLRVVRQAVGEFGLKLKELHNDSTTVTFQGAYREADGRSVRGKRTVLISRGFNKDHRQDLKQLLWQLTVSSDGAVPVHYHLWDGNTSDDTTHRGTWDLVQEIVGHPRFLYVSDCKLCDQETLRHIDRRGGRFLTLMPRTRKEEKAFRQWMQDHEVPWEKLMSRAHLRGKSWPRDLYRGFDSPIPSAEGFRIVWIHTSEKQKRDAEARQQKIDRVLQALEALRERLASPRSRMKSRAKVDRAVEAALEEACRWIAVEVQSQQEVRYRQEQRGRPGLKTRYRKLVRQRYGIHWAVKQEAVRYDARSDGIFPLITNEKDLLMKELLRAYKRQANVETRHEQLKNTHEVAPQYLKSAARIEALLCTFFLALLTNAIMEREMRRSMRAAGIQHLPLYPEGRECKRPTTERILELFEKLQVHRLRGGKEVEEVFEPELTRLQRKVLKLLQVPVIRYTAS